MFGFTRIRPRLRVSFRGFLFWEVNLGLFLSLCFLVHHMLTFQTTERAQPLSGTALLLWLWPSPIRTIGTSASDIVLTAHKPCRCNLLTERRLVLFPHFHSIHHYSRLTMFFLVSWCFSEQKFCGYRSSCAPGNGSPTTWTTLSNDEVLFFSIAFILLHFIIFSFSWLVFCLVL
jgi:hypothetical protein